MEVREAKDFLEDAMYDDHFAEKCLDWYANDVCIVLSKAELNELHLALNEWVAQNNIVKVQTVARINNEISKFTEEPATETGDDEPEDDDIYECDWCHEEYPYWQLKHIIDGSLMCERCVEGIRSRGERVQIIEG